MHLCSFNKHHDGKQLKEERVYFLLQIKLHYQGKSRHELKAEVWSRNCGEKCCFLACSVFLLLKSKPTSLGLMLSTVGWAFPHQSSIKIIPHIQAHRAIWQRQLFNWGSLFSGDSGLYQVWQQKTNQHKNDSRATIRRIKYVTIFGMWIVQLPGNMGSSWFCIFFFFDSAS